MKKIINRTLIVFIIMILLIEFSFGNICHAADTDTDDIINLINNLVGGIVSIIIWIPKLFSTIIIYVFDFIAANGIASADGILNIDGTVSSGPKPTIVTPFDIFFNHYKLLDINVFDRGTNPNLISYKLKTAVSTWFYIVRNISASILLVILIYVGIRMALSTVASEKARYKKMFTDWIVSLILIFVIQYIAIFIIYLNNGIVKFIENLVADNILEEVIKGIFYASLLGAGSTSIMAFLVYLMISVQTMLFLIAYFNRLLKISFLVIISPLISVTYSIDKMGDGKAQALEGWLKEFTYSILIQPFDCIMYLAFAASALQLINADGVNVNQLANGVLAILCLKFINDGEKIIAKIFNFQDSTQDIGMATGAAIAVMAVQKAQKAGSTGKKFLGKNSQFSKALANDLNKLNNSKFGQNAAKMMEKMNNTSAVKGVNQAINKIGNSKVGNAMKNISGFNRNAKNKIYKLMNGGNKTGIKGLLGQLPRKSTAAVAGMMGAAMMAATGADGMTSFAAGKRVFDMADSNIYKGTISGSLDDKDLKEADAREEDRAREELDGNIQNTEEELERYGLTEEEMDDTDSLDEKAGQAEQEYENAKKEGTEPDKADQDQMKAEQEKLEKLREKQARNASRLDERIGKETNKGKKKKLLADKQRLAAQDKKEIENQEKRIQALQEKMDADVATKKEKLAQKAEAASLARAISKKAHQRKDLLTQKANFDTPEARKERIREYSRGVSDQEFESQKANIMALLAGIIASKRASIDKETDVDDINQIVTPDDIDRAEELTQHMADAIKYSMLTGGSFDTAAFIADSIGLESDREGSVGYFMSVQSQRLEKEIEKYKSLEDKQFISERAFGIPESLGMKEDDIVNQLYDNVTRGKKK